LKKAAPRVRATVVAGYRFGLYLAVAHVFI
jgi:hypothetical protein